MECSEAALSCPRRFRSGFGGAYRRFCFPRFSDALLMWSRISTSLKRGALHRKHHAVPYPYVLRYRFSTVRCLMETALAFRYLF